MEVVILAGGLGTRLRNVVSEVPKCMAPVAGRPFLWYLLEQLRHFEVERVILSVGYLREVIMEWADKHAAGYPFEIVFAVEEEPLGTGGGIRLAAQKAVGPDVVVLNGDTFYDVDLQALVDYRRAAGTLVAIALKPMCYFDRYGTVTLGADGIIEAFREKAPCEKGLINGGVCALDLSSGVLEGHGGRFSFEKDVLEPLCAAGKVAGLVQEGYFIDIGIPEDYARARREPWLLQHRCPLSDAVRTLCGFDTLLLDRDGVINRMLPDDYVKSYDEFEWLPGALEALADAAGKFPRIYIVSNQRGVGKGIMT